MKLMLSKFFKKEYLLLYVFILAGAFLRLWGVYTNSFAFTYDVGRDMLALNNIVHLHKIPLIGATTGINGIFYGPWWYYMLTPFFIIFSGNPQGIAFLMAFLGILTIVLGYVLGKKIGGNFLGISMALIISVSPNLISLSSQIWNPNVTPLFVVLILFILNEIYTKREKAKPKFYLILGLLLALNIDLEIVFGLLLSTGIILSLILILRNKIILKNIFYLIVGYLIIFSPKVFFEIRHQFLMTKTLIGLVSQAGASHGSLNLLTLVPSRLGIFFDQFNSTLFFNNVLFGAFVLLFTVFCILFFYKKADEKIKNFINTSLIVIFVFLTGTIFFSHDIWPHYLAGLPVFYILLFSISLYLFMKKSSNILFPVLMLIILFIFNLNPVNIFRSLTSPLWVGDASVYRNQLSVIDYVYSQAKGKDFKYVVYTPPVYDYTYQYLFSWYGPEKYHYAPQVQANLAFFILEPDLQYPSRLIDWLKLRQKDGKIINSEKLPSGIIVQTRVH